MPVKSKTKIDIRSSKHKVSIETAKCELCFVFNEIVLKSSIFTKKTALR
jgi:hypothetical protein